MNKKLKQVINKALLKKEKFSIELRKYWFGRMKPIDFEDFGKIEKTSKCIDGEMYWETSLCPVCHNKIRAGRKKETYIWWCNKCGWFTRKLK